MRAEAEVRRATLEDVSGVVNVHTAGEELEGLSVAERYSRGGPWMSPETLAVHLNNLLLDDQLAAVAEIDGEIVGEVEVLFSEELVKGEIRRIGHVDVIEVHPDHRGAGVGRALMEFAEEAARERGAEMLTVQPDEEAEGFYRRLGFGLEIFTGAVVWIPADAQGHEGAAEKPTPESRPNWEDVKNLELVAGRFQSSYSVFFSAFKDDIGGIHYTIEAGRAGRSRYALRNLPGRSGAALYLWGRLDDLAPVLRRAGELGIDRVLTVTPLEEEEPEPATLRKAETAGRLEMLAKRL
ncbi:MAG: GNAT family N-acetyltransferase [Thermococci archaeon]|nr:GNAT family N-acetyltransferase [Thermococci archaeon]